MNIKEIIAKKRDGLELNKEEIKYFIEEYTKGTVTDYQAAALIMAMYINGLNNEETTNLTLEMAHSGEILDLSKISKTVIDKHSTGGVGDKITLVLMPIIASLGVPVAKMSGRGLGFTGGTVDKLESIPGYKTEIKIDEFIENVQKVGISLIGQTANLAPADKKIYALRDTISCVDNMSLIASSIMSKKIAAGANKIVLDVTCGSGAFMQNEKDAIELSNIMKNIGKLANRETVCIITNMDEPVGYAIGNSLEIIETIECLKGNIPEDIKEIITTIGAYILKLADKGDNLEENKLKILENIKNGKAYNKFLELVQNQNGDIEYVKNTDKFEKAKYEIKFFAENETIIKSLNAEKIGRLTCYLGAGRIKKEDKIDMAVGIVLNKKVGDLVKTGDLIATIYSNDLERGEKVKKELQYNFINDNIKQKE